MIPALVSLYVLLIGLAAWGSVVSFRLERRYRFPFLRMYHFFVLLSFAYALVNLIGEAFLPTVFTGPAESLVPAYMIVDLLTIPLLGGLFFLLFAWIFRLLDRRISPTLRAVFIGIEAIFLATFLISFVSYFVRGISTLTYAAVVILNGIILALLLAAVLLLGFAAPAGEARDRRRLARGLGFAYAAVLTVLIASLTMGRMFSDRHPALGRILPAGLTFLVNWPALLYLRKSLRTISPLREPAFTAGQGWDGLARDVGLSDREKEIVRLAAAGLDNREIGEKLFISPKTVKNHMTSIYAKTGARNRVQLANRLNRPEADRERIRS